MPLVKEPGQAVEPVGESDHPCAPLAWTVDNRGGRGGRGHSVLLGKTPAWPVTRRRRRPTGWVAGGAAGRAASCGPAWRRWHGARAQPGRACRRGRRAARSDDESRHGHRRASRRACAGCVPSGRRCGPRKLAARACPQAQPTGAVEADSQMRFESRRTLVRRLVSQPAAGTVRAVDAARSAPSYFASVGTACSRAMRSGDLRARPSSSRARASTTGLPVFRRAERSAAPSQRRADLVVGDTRDPQRRLPRDCLLADAETAQGTWSRIACRRAIVHGRDVPSPLTACLPARSRAPARARERWPWCWRSAAACGRCPSRRAP